MNRYLITLAALTIPCAAVAQAPMAASTYLMKAGAGDLYEKTSSQTVLTSTNPKVKAFAQMMITDHTKSTAEVKRAAMAAKLKVAPPKLDSEQARNIAALRAVNGSARDSLYIEQQKMAHDKALALHQGYGATGTVRGLRTVAMTIVPVVQTHISELKTM